MHTFSRKESFLLANTLNCIPLLLQGHAVLIDLRNETSVAGIIDNADGHMNVHLTEAVFIDRKGRQYPFQQFMVPERMIRQIHIPAGVDVSEKMRDWYESGGLRRKKQEHSKRKRTFKEKRTQERHKETLLEIQRTRQQQQTAEK